jgi:signal transduction histidine kinase
MLVDSAAAKNEWRFRSKIYPGAPDPFSPEVIVEIDPGSGSALMRIVPQLIFSVLITAAMLLLFLLIYREALRQKKISDIRRDFINNMTHEFKTPLATMSLAADTIMNEKIVGDPDKVKYYAHQIKSENRKLNQQVEKVLELALTEKTGVVMHKEQVNVTDLLLRAIRSMQLQVEAKGGMLVLENNPQEVLLNADAFHLERAFVNLLDNALKYGGTPPRIVVSMEQFRSGTQIRITDNGAGIAQSEWKLIFDPFYRVSTGDVHNVKGSGLGLSYAQSVIKEHNGSISVTQSNASGSTFTIVLMHELLKTQNS